MRSLAVKAAILLLGSNLIDAAPSPPHGVHPSRSEREVDGSLILDFDRRDGNVLAKRGSQLKIVKCTEDQESAITGAWGHMLDMARLVNEEIGQGIDFESEIAKDFFGRRAQDDTGFHSGINGMVLSVLQMHPDFHKPQSGDELPLKLNMRCDDINWKSFWSGMSDREIADDSKCPVRMKIEDAHKCQSRCWKWRMGRDPREDYSEQIPPQTPQWSYNAIAYTINPVHTPRPGHVAGTITFCPAWFERPSCRDAYDKYSGNANEKDDLTNYLCRETDLMHELMHVDAYRERYSNIKEHVDDRVFRIQSPFNDDRIEDRKAYGPFFTRVLARWMDRPAKYTGTNADSLALFWLSNWIKKMGGFYPSRPEAYVKPYNVDSLKRSVRDLFKKQVSNELWDPIAVIGDYVSFFDDYDVMKALDAESEEEALEMHAYDEELDNRCTMEMDEEGEEDEEHFGTLECHKPEILDLDPEVGGEFGKPTTTATSCSKVVTDLPAVTLNGEVYPEEKDHTMCMCGESHQAQYAEIPGDGGDYIYGVCLTDPNQTIESIKVEATTSDSPAEPTRMPENCSICNDIMGASMCYFPTQDDDCLRKECAELEECRGCDAYCKLLVGDD